MSRRIPVSRLRPPTLYTFGEAELLALDDRTAQILRMRAGILDGQLYSLPEIGEEVGLRGERVRQLQNEGFSVIRQIRETQRRMRGEPIWPQARQKSRK